MLELKFKYKIKNDNVNGMLWLILKNVKHNNTLLTLYAVNWLQKLYIAIIYMRKIIYFPFMLSVNIEI